MAKRINAETQAAIVEAYLADESLSHRDLAERFGVSPTTIAKYVDEYFKAGNGIKPDRRKNGRQFLAKVTEGELDERHGEVMQKFEHPRTGDWMACITPLHRHKMALEQRMEHKQAELDAARQEYRDFLATLRQLMEEQC